MENKNPKFNRFYFITWNIFKALGLIFFAYYIAENIAFTIIYGWHWTAQSDIEKYFDLIGGILSQLALAFFVVSCFGVIDYCIQLIKHVDNGNEN